MKALILKTAALLTLAVMLTPSVTLAENEEDDWIEQGFEDPDAYGKSGEELGIDYFIDRLSPYGDWLETKEYGWVWQPNGVEDDWRPFTYGHWEYTDYGWTWVSHFPWGWAAFHYGSWAHMETIGWVWVPAGLRDQLLQPAACRSLRSCSRYLPASANIASMLICHWAGRKSSASILDLKNHWRKLFTGKSSATKTRRR